MKVKVKVKVKAIQNTRTDHVSLNLSPSVCHIALSRDCEIIDVCDKLKSCPGQIPDRTLLFGSMTAADVVLLKEMCLDTTANHDFMVLKVHLFDYRYAYAVRSSVPDYAVVLFLYKSYREFIDLGKESMNFTSHPPSVLSGTFPELFSVTNFLSSNDAVTLLRLICSRFSRSGEAISSRVEFYESDFTPDMADSSGCVPSGPLALIFTTLLSILDSTSSDGVLNVNVSRFSGSLEVRMNTRSQTVENTFGEVSDVLLLSGQLKGTFSRLSLASFAAAESEMYLTGSVSPLGEVSFFFGYIPETFPTLEFKFDDPADKSDLLVDSVLRLFGLPEFTFE